MWPSGEIDTALVVLRFESGALGVIDNSRAAGYGYECSTEVMGELATTRIARPQHRHYQWLTPAGAAYGINRDFEERYPLVYVEEMEAAPAPGFHEEARATPRPVPALGRGHLV